MSEIQLYFALVCFVIYFNHQKCDPVNGETTIILSSAERKKVANVIELARQENVDCNDFYKILKNMVDEKRKADEENSRTEEIRKNFVPFFSCALNEVMKPLLEVVYDLSIPLKRFIREDDIPPIPQYLVDISRDHDTWLNNVEESSNTSAIQDQDHLQSEKWKLWYKNWYRFVTYDEEFRSKVASFVQTALNNLKTGKMSDYEEYDVRVKFSAEMARCFSITCVVHHDFMKIVRSKAHEHGGNFVEGLLEVAPTWYLTKEAVRFMNILRLSQELAKAKDDQRRQEVRNNFKHIACMMVMNKKGEKVCLPFLDSKECYIPNTEKDESSILSFLKSEY